MSKEPLISIITASFNNEATIERHICSIKNQTFRNFEHIVVDGASTDATVKTLKKHVSDYPLKWISEPDSGIAEALNKGLKLATGVYIIVIQADDFLYADSVLGDVAAVLERDEHDMYAGSVAIEDQSKGVRVLSPSKTPWRFRFKTPFLHQGTFVHRKVFDAIGIFNERFKIAMDYDFFYRAKLNPFNAFLCPEKIITLMSADGLGSHRSFTKKRILEEFKVQRTHNKSFIWKIIYVLYRTCYFPYKMLTNS